MSCVSGLSSSANLAVKLFAAEKGSQSGSFAMPCRDSTLDFSCMLHLNASSAKPFLHPACRALSGQGSAPLSSTICSAVTLPRHLKGCKVQAASNGQAKCGKYVRGAGILQDLSRDSVRL